LVEQTDPYAELPPVLRAFAVDLAEAMRRDEHADIAPVSTGATVARRLHRSVVRGRSFRTPLVVAAALVGVSGGVGGLALAGEFDGTAISPQAVVNGGSVQVAPTTTTSQTGDLSILRRSRTAADALPASVDLNTPGDPISGNGANPALSRRAVGISPGAAWLVPGDGVICFVAQFPIAGGGETCQPDATVNEGRMMLAGIVAPQPGLAGVAGVVPDGVSTVTVTSTDGTTTSVPVHENVYMAELRGGFSVSFTGPTGTVTVGSYVPPTASNTSETPQSAPAPTSATGG
jgi:hypothetical protein